MPLIKRFSQNPILSPNQESPWEGLAVFNGCPLKTKEKIYLVYRALSPTPLSSIGIAESKDGINFPQRRQLIKPEKEWERFGCEDPRITQLGDRYYIFYTALSHYPPRAEGIKVAVALTNNLKEIQTKHLVTPFNAKAMALFPEKIQGKIAAVLTVNTDQPPAKICLAFFEQEKHIWDQEFWHHWYQFHDNYCLSLTREEKDHVEVGAPPIKTKQGWLLIYCCIKNYGTPESIFGIEAVLLDLKDPLKIIKRTNHPLFTPEKNYELKGIVPNVIFPSGALLQDDQLYIYYGGADTVCCLAKANLNQLLASMKPEKEFHCAKNPKKLVKLERLENNPIIEPRKNLDWEEKGTFNPAAIYLDHKVHLLYRAFSQDHTSSLGYARLKNGIEVELRLTTPAYTPREKFEKKAAENVWAGCEDPRLTLIKNTIYMCYTAYDGVHATRVALTSIKTNDFLNQRWQWTKPQLISPPGINDKNATILPEKIDGYYFIFHRINPCIWIDVVKNLDFKNKQWIKGKPWFRPRTDKWDSRKIGIAGPPIRTEKGWLLLYHAVSETDRKYRVGLMLLDLKNPTKVLARPDDFLLEPEKDYEQAVKKVVFPCGNVVVKNKLLVYYGAADHVVAGAQLNLDELLNSIL